MRILLNCLTISPGGGLTVLLRLIRVMAQSGHECHVLAGVPASIEAIRGMAADRQNLTLHPRLTRSGAAVKFLLAGPIANRLAERESCDVAMGINYYYPLRIPQITFHLNLLHFTSRPADSRGFGARLRDHFSAKALRQSDMNVFESSYLLENAREMGGEINRPRVIYSPNILDDVGQVVECQRSRKIIVAVTSDQPHKDNPTLIRMLHRLHQDGASEMRLVIIGGGPQSFGTERRLVREFGLSEHVTFVGRLERAALAERLASAFCLVSTSRVESFCMVATEAMSVGCPVVVSDCAAMPESVGDFGLRAEPGNAEAFAMQVMALRDDDALYQRLSVGGKEFVQAYSQTRYQAALADMMRETSELLLRQSDLAQGIQDARR